MNADLSALPPIDIQLGSDPVLLLDELRSIIARRIADHPRSQQTRLGPSEIGDPCARRLAYKLTGLPKAREMSTPWRPTVGTAVHAWLEEALAEDNTTLRQRIGTSRWLMETSIDAGPMAGARLTGHSDLYDRITCTVIDWKIIGPSAHKTLRADLNTGRGPRPEYQVQLHTYGLGYVNRGLHVERVMLVALPAAGELDDALMWHAPWDRAVADAAMARVDRIHALTATLGPAALTVTNGQLRAAGVPQLADGDDDGLAVGMDGHGCRFCPWLAAGSDDPVMGCPGADATANTRHLEALIA